MKLAGFAIVCGLLAGLHSPEAQAATVTVLSGAAVEPGLEPVAELFARRTGDSLRIEYATGPEIRSRIEAGETPDVIVAPAAVVSALGARVGPAVPVGAVGVGMAVRAGASRPDISSVAALTAAVRAAPAVVFSRGSSGVYVEQLLRRLGLYETARIERVANGGAVVTRLARGVGDEIGFSAMTELMLGQKEGVVVVGPLPPAVQNDTLYSAAPLAGARARPEVGRLITLLGEAEAQAVMEAAGLHAPVRDGPPR